MADIEKLTFDCVKKETMKAVRGDKNPARGMDFGLHWLD